MGIRCCAWAFSSCSEWGVLSSCSVWASHWGWLLFLQSTGSRVKAQKLWHTGLVAPWHMGSSWTRDQSVSLALVGGFSTTGPLGKLLGCFFKLHSRDYTDDPPLPPTLPPSPLLNRWWRRGIDIGGKKNNFILKFPVTAASLIQYIIEKILIFYLEISVYKLYYIRCIMYYIQCNIKLDFIML